jgi:Translationally controlled tumour protein
VFDMAVTFPFTGLSIIDCALNYFQVRTDTFDIDSSAIGGNASAEGGEGDEGAEATSKQGVDIVMNSRLVEYGLNKKDYITHIKGYMAE